MNHWLEIRTALSLARFGTVSAAAQALGVHRATVNRHVDRLESEFGVKLFQRHSRGYVLTEAGQAMFDVADRADRMLEELQGRVQFAASQLSGELVISSLAGVAAHIMPAIRAFRDKFPGLKVIFQAQRKLTLLEYGEAHIAIRAGPKPKQPDYVVVPYRAIRFGLYASRDYIKNRGMPSADDFTGHHFISSASQASRLPFAHWLHEGDRQSKVALQTDDRTVASTAVINGLGLGFLAEPDAAGQADLVPVIAPSELWQSNLWFVTHVDIHRTEKVQAFLKFAKKSRPEDVNGTD